MGKLFFQAIEFGRSSSWIVGEKLRLAFTARGNLELWQKPGFKLLWESGTTDKGATFVMQSDGNMVIYDAARKSVWASDTAGNPEAMLAAEEEGRLVIYAADLTTILWQSDVAERAGSPGLTAEAPADAGEPAADEKPSGEQTSGAAEPAA